MRKEARSYGRRDRAGRRPRDSARLRRLELTGRVASPRGGSRPRRLVERLVQRLARLRRSSTASPPPRAASMNRRSLRGSFWPGRASTPVATSTPHGRTSRIASPTLSGVSPPAIISRTPPGAPSASRQSNTLPEPGLGRIDEHDVGRRVRRGAERGIAGGEPWMTNAHALADPAHLRQRLGCPTAARRAARRAPATSTTCSGRSLRNTPTGSTSGGRRLTMSRTPFGVDLPRARSEDEAERVGAERGREQRVVLVGDAADLDEHQSASAVRPCGAASSRTSADGIVGAHERFADEHRVEAGARPCAPRRRRCAPRSRPPRSRRAGAEPRATRRRRGPRRTSRGCDC